MPMILAAQNVAAGAVNNNIISGSAFEFARVRQLVSMGVVQSATGGFSTITSGPDIIAEEFLPAIVALASPIIIPDHMYFTDYMEPGDRLVIRYRNPTGGALDVRALVQTSPV
jgi:hypothetical protein